MARIDIKGISKLRKRFELAAIAYADATRKADAKASAASKSLRIAERDEAFDKLLSHAIDLVGGLATADDGVGVSTRDAEHRLTQTVGDINTHGFNRSCAAAIQLLKKQPYRVVFAHAEKAAAK
jgi:hypothetical protein